MDITVKIIWDEGADTGLPLPTYETAGAAGADLRANLAEEAREEGVDLAPGERMLIPTGLRVAVPEGYELQVRPRSGLALKHGLMVPNTPGTIDSDYRGPLGVILLNAGSEPFRVTHGMRVAQAVLAPVTRAEFRIVETMEETERGASGFGSTGTG
ncbi:dUTP diphosphatase [Pseudoroseicyclus tamaricis]|uniref:Deoxyuridine 5'-triphosphate nucleotidohydrolase n=1 Tax=Pseudoroseicyclus tamaricis TaxID=2705421 RepID=A0A6B2JPT5_9RHOB|nr:dUTP diphosphatase [Pseudoroseicyclus tamaricis]NDV00118.1 dUTP diphosphatase [Pseudoroseicyclus tamaricis]